ncbi:unnamed protein product [Prorocentrum cordatum]|uniref:Uncharacterized protein n=1 Tax=Prorocentrum cordatum TaxID=2364126 RepID=A0ABN9SZN1_9DINO|nr:unnamed protein product [Polarella glacialis]
MVNTWRRVTGNPLEAGPMTPPEVYPGKASIGNVRTPGQRYPSGAAAATPVVFRQRSRRAAGSGRGARPRAASGGIRQCGLEGRGTTGGETKEEEEGEEEETDARAALPPPSGRRKNGEATAGRPRPPRGPAPYHSGASWDEDESQQAAR